jgi:phosphopantetheine--protein transferase-like protein
VLALSQRGPVGIDVENHERGNDLAAIAQRFFSMAENESLTKLDGQAWLQQFFAIWTLKEAHGKALGTGLSKILSCSSFLVDIRRRSVTSILTDVAAPNVPVFNWLHRLDDTTTLAFAQLRSAAPTPSLIRCVPLAAESSLTLQLLATGSWLPER